MRQRENTAKSEELRLRVSAQWKQAPLGSDSSLTHTIADWCLLCAHALTRVEAGINISQSSLVPRCQQPALSRLPDSTTKSASSEAAGLAGPQRQPWAPSLLPGRPALSPADAPPLLQPLPPTAVGSCAAWGEAAAALPLPAVGSPAPRSPGLGGSAALAAAAGQGSARGQHRGCGCCAEPEVDRGREGRFPRWGRASSGRVERRASLSQSSERSGTSPCPWTRSCELPGARVLRPSLPAADAVRGGRCSACTDSCCSDRANGPRASHSSEDLETSAVLGQHSCCWKRNNVRVEDGEELCPRQHENKQ